MTDRPPIETGCALPRIVFYERAGCHLCVDAWHVVADVADESGESTSRVDVDADPTGRLRAELGDLVPVVEVDGVRIDYWTIDSGRLRNALARRPGQRIGRGDRLRQIFGRARRN